MIGRILGASLTRQGRRKMVAFAAVTLGTGAASALLNVALGVGDKVSRELRGFGANLAVSAEGSAGAVMLAGEDVTALRAPAYLPQGSLQAAKENFWTHNILALAPELDVPARVAGRSVLLRGTWFDHSLPLSSGDAFPTGLRAVFPHWRAEGDWPADDAPGAGALVGASLARALGVKPGDEIEATVDGASAALQVAGILSTGGDEDRMVLAPLAVVQRLARLDGRIGRILVSALTTPEDAAAARLGLDPQKLDPEEFERWSCTPFISSIAYELESSIPGSEAHPIRRVAAAEGAVLDRISGLMALLAFLSIGAAALTVASSLTTGVLERRGEIGLLKALGATNGRVVGLFLLEAAALGAAGGIAGAATGAAMAHFLARAVFGSTLELSPLALPLSVLAAIGITLLGCALPARRISSFRPYEVLHGL